MDSWWNGLDGFSKVFWVTATISTLFFVIQTILTFIGGGDADMDMDTDFDTDFNSDVDVSVHGHGEGSSFFGFFTIRNMVAFFLGFSWFGLACIDKGISKFWTVIIGCVCGSVLVIIVMAMMRALMSLQSSGTISLKNAIGQEGDVQIAIPADMEGKGRVNVVIQGRRSEVPAATKGERLTKGTQIKVVGVLGNQSLLVEKFKS